MRARSQVFSCLFHREEWIPRGRDNKDVTHPERDVNIRRTGLRQERAGRSFDLQEATSCFCRSHFGGEFLQSPLTLNVTPFDGRNADLSQILSLVLALPLYMPGPWQKDPFAQGKAVGFL